MNKAILIGNIGRDPEVRNLASGGRVVTFSVATSEHWKDKASGERKEKTEWHNVVCFNENLGRVIESYAKKGTKVAIEGAIQTRKWQDKEGHDRYTTEIVMTQFGGSLELLSPKGESAGHDDPPPPPASGGRALRDQLDDDIPFAPEWR